MTDHAISPAKLADLDRRMIACGIREQDLCERFIRSGGKGGQNVNKVASCVYLKHLPSGMEVKCQKERSQSLNRFFARRLLVERMEALALGKASAAEREREKIRRQKRKRSRRAKEKMLGQKRLQSLKKELRAPLKDHA